jgi:hypothetical protein
VAAIVCDAEPEWAICVTVITLALDPKEDHAELVLDREGLADLQAIVTTLAERRDNHIHLACPEWAFGEYELGDDVPEGWAPAKALTIRYLR